MSDVLTHPNPDKFDSKFIPATGAIENVKIYIIGDVPTEDDVKSRKPFSGRLGQYFQSMVKIAGIDESTIRYSNCIPYRPIDKSISGREINRAVSVDEISLYKIFIFKDIERVNPEKIVCLGRTAMNIFSIDESVTSARSKTYYHNNIPVNVTYHPSYVDRNGGDNSNAYNDVIS